MMPTERPAWMDDANCRGLDVEMFFPTPSQDTRAIQLVCRECDVQAECLTYAIVHAEKHGIWGGLSDRQRRKLRRGRSLRVVAS